jgi:hypothetical protein
LINEPAGTIVNNGITKKTNVILVMDIQNKLMGDLTWKKTRLRIYKNKTKD